MIVQWTWSDAWLLQSIALATGGQNSGTDLKGILMMGDGINHAIFTVDELRHGLEKLTSIDFVKIENNKFFLTKIFFAEYALLGKHPKDIIDKVNQVEKLLNAKLLVKTKIKRIGTSIISKSRLNNAYMQYQQQFRQ